SGHRVLFRRVELVALSKNHAVTVFRAATTRRPVRTGPVRTPSSWTQPDVDPAEYTSGDGYYRWTIGTNPQRLCAISPTTATGQQLTCSVTFPPDTPGHRVPVPRPAERDPDRPGERLAPHHRRGGPLGDRELPPNSRIRVGDIECTALPDNGFDCTTPDAAFRLHDNTLTARGQAAAPAATPPPPTPSDGPYDTTEIVGPGTACGAATGDIIVKVEAGTISCAEALATITKYRALPPDPTAGNTNNHTFDGWQCMSQTAAMAADLGYSTSCRNETTATHLTTPVAASKPPSLRVVRDRRAAPYSIGIVHE
uniref:hypothetical protein n=1 Tax=Nocardia farcinica TaxID=37329 RepID=UPI0024569FA1